MKRASIARVIRLQATELHTLQDFSGTTLEHECVTWYSEKLRLMRLMVSLRRHNVNFGSLVFAAAVQHSVETSRLSIEYKCRRGVDCWDTGK